MIGIKYDLYTINEKRNLVRNLIYDRSVNINEENFNVISSNDLYLLFDIYDKVFLNNWFKENFKGKIIFKLSKQLSKAAGNTRTKKNISLIKDEDIEFEIKISLNHLNNFDKVERNKSVGGIQVNSKIDSVMLVFEHELCHVIEFLIYKKSSCKKKPFKELIYDVFGQTETTHNLINAHEANINAHDFKIGDKVCFNYESKKLIGFVSRINKRATVMSPDKRGSYVDKMGNRYIKFYVPLNGLEKNYK